MTFEWDQANSRHIARHKVASEEAEQVLCNEPLIRDFLIVDGEERWASLGVTNRGRILLVWWAVRKEAIRIVTAFEPSKRLKKIYLKERGKDSTMSSRRTLNTFRSEAEEARWVFRHQALLAEAFESPEPSQSTLGQILTKTGGKGKRSLVAVELSSADLARSRRLAANARIGHESYLKRLLHKAIAEEAQRLL